MSDGTRWSLRARLALAAFVLAATPVVVLVAVTFATDERVDTFVDSDADQPETRVRRGPSVSVWVPLAAGLLLVPISLAAWWWSGRAVRPLGDISELADEIQQGSLDRRINLRGTAREVQALGDSFDNMLDRLATASQTQRRLLEEASHELRTPLAALAATSEILRTDPDAALRPHRDTLQRIDRQVRVLQSTVDHLLAAARSREGMTRQTDNDLAEIVDRVVDTQRAAAPGVEIVVAAPDTLRLGIEGPAVERAVANLLENAVRHTPPRGVVHVGLVAEQTAVKLTVTDEGPGIDPAHQATVFDRYFQGETVRTGGNAGIGLAIVKQVADAYGGVTVESPLGPHGGTRFTLSFPTET